jgi:aspartyl protease family protein
MMIAAWALALAVLTLLFSDLLERERNPNRSVQSVVEAGGGRSIVLERNRAGHYLAEGRINGHPVTFLVDTGATDVAVPERVARRIGLERGRPTVSRTAAGDVRTWSTLLRTVDLGGIELHGIRATILPDAAGDEVLLGMSYLKRLELVQRGGTLTLRLPGAGP